MIFLEMAHSALCVYIAAKKSPNPRRYQLVSSS
uniref:Uncharacterized protein n=1 Tax=Anguilla anguilla TaxID=7936 RepID=A0A0E9R9F3_ANGAN